MTDEIGFDPGGRVLCPDGSCTGVLGADGRCSECGRTGEVPAGYTGAAAVVPDAALVPDASGADASNPSADAPGATDSHLRGVDLEGAGFDERRPLCPDGACVGVLGPDGRCPVCGQMAGGPAGGASTRQESL